MTFLPVNTKIAKRIRHRSIGSLREFLCVYATFVVLYTEESIPVMSGADERRRGNVYLASICAHCPGQSQMRLHGSNRY